jgi:hypothetical protein
MKENNYNPQPINVSDVVLTDDVKELLEKLARNTHEVWARGRIDHGWTWGPVRNDELKQHPDLVPYEQLTEGEKQYDRDTARSTLLLITKLGYEIKKR